MENKREYQICTRCVMDTTDPDIVFDENGVCNHCIGAIKGLEKIRIESEEERKKKINDIVNTIKESGKGKKYDCIIGLSGGVDSSYLAYVVVKRLGLRPLAVHLDNGWNSELAVKNIENIVKKLNIDLFTHVIDWEEFRDLQKAYLKASVLDLEVLSDNAIVVAIHNLLKKYNLKYFLIGFNMQAESIMPANWLYSPKYDSKNILSIYRKFGNKKRLKTYPLFNFLEYIRYRFFDNSRTINILDTVPYVKKQSIEILEKELGWKDYGGKHFESRITQFYQSHILPVKFNVDKRRAHLSSLIVSNQITRQQALKILNQKLYDPKKLEADIEYFCKKLELTRDEFTTIMNTLPVSHYKYASYNKLFDRLAKLKQKL